MTGLAIVLASILAYAWYRERQAERAEAFRRHVTREAIWQMARMHPWERGDVPQGETLDRTLARRIARGRTRSVVLHFKRSGER